jgi:PAS domain S-box-containing protein
LQKIISDPIIELTNITNEITEKGDYSIRLKNLYYDEIGLLFNEFNQMLQVIQNREKERDFAEESLRDSEMRYRRLTENAKDAIYRISIPDGFYEYMSPAIVEMSGYSPNDFYKEPLFMKKIMHPSFHAWFENIWSDIVHGNVLPAYEYQVIHKNGDVRWFYQKSVIVKDANGYPVALEAIATDITDRKRIEEEVKQLNAELEDRVRRRTAELQSANNELKDFAYVVSHDLKAPLRGISQLSQWFLQDYKDELDKDGQELAELLIKRVDRLNKLINGILEYSRVGRIVNKEEKIELKELLEDIIDILNPPKHFSFNLPEYVPVIVADRIRIEQVFQNLVSNAIKYCDKQDAKVEILFEDLDEFYQFAVKDNGVGIDKKYHEKIFGIFQTLEQKEDNDNTGIGLSIVKKIIELYGGSVWIESSMDEYTIFYFTLSKSKVAYE